MREKIFISRIVLFICPLCILWFGLQAQHYNCTFKDPLLTIDFGTGNDAQDLQHSPLPNYNLVSGTCPIDGNYSLASYTSDCFGGDWLTFNEDHTLNDRDGKMMLVNASVTGGVFFNITINGLRANTSYQVAAWMINLCKVHGNCPPLPPNIVIRLMASTGERVAAFGTGPLPQISNPYWRRYSGIFTTPADVTSLVLTMEDITLGGCGNDFALDDIVIRECFDSTLLVKADVKSAPKSPEKPLAKETKAPAKKIPVKQQPVKKIPTEILPQKPEIDEPEIALPKIKEKPAVLPLPIPILSRANPLVKTIESVAGEIFIELYDNGQIDGDTVSIYHNNELIISRAGLSDKAISFRIKLDATHPHHELIMVANNLGSIPPNTSLMIVTANNKRFEVFISSSEQKNAKVVFDLKE